MGVALLLLAVSAAAQTSLPDTVGAPRPPSGLVATDVPNDAGRSIELAWKASPDDVPGAHVVAQVRQQRGGAVTVYLRSATDDDGCDAALAVVV